MINGLRHSFLHDSLIVMMTVLAVSTGDVEQFLPCPHSPTVISMLGPLIPRDPPLFQIQWMKTIFWMVYESQLFQLSQSTAVISTLSLTIQRDAYNNGISWKIHGVALQMIYGGDKSSDHCGVCPLELFPDGLFLMGLGFARILTARLWKQPPWKPPWRKQMGGDVDAVFIRESLPEPSSIQILSRRQVMCFYLSVWNRLTVFGKVGVLLCPALVLVNDAICFNGISEKVHPRSKNTSSRITIASARPWKKLSVVSPKEVFDKCKDTRSQNKENIKSTFLSRMRIHTNWYSLNISKHVTDAMAFIDTIWKAKEAMPIWHTHRIKVRQIGKKKDNSIQWLLFACKAYLARRKQRSSFFLIFVFYGTYL